MDKNRLMELAGVEQKPAKVQQLNENAGIIGDIVHDAIWDVLTQLKVKAPEHTINDAVASAVHRYEQESAHSEDEEMSGMGMGY